MKALWACLLALGIAGAADAQPSQFDVATVKLSAPVPFGTPISINLGTFRNGSLTLTNVTLSECLQFAYGTASMDQIAGPDWIQSRDVRFDIVAKTAVDAELGQARRLLQALLSDRLQVVVRHEPRPFSFLALVPAKGGPRLVPSNETRPPAVTNTSFRGRIAGDRMPIAVLASLLSRFERQLVVDRTGLTGRYQVKLEWAPDDRAGGGDDLSTGPSLFAALREQLGLRLESRKEPLDVVVVEHAERVPADN
jgi:uncharacterized protein (TIGR03435 family)